MKPKRTIDGIPYSFCPNHTATIEALATARLSGREFRVVLFIMRQTNGYLREEDQISLRFFRERTGITKSNLCHVLARLSDLNIVAIGPGKPPAYSVNPPEKWKSEALSARFVENDNESLSDLTTNVVENDNKQVRTKDNTKDNYYRKQSKDNNKYTRGKYGHMVRR